mmetsp:Transcript_37013/g.115905  ORF Transcript_37013/g.115905 Transcript_37013/m.115905 type:complete len:664 (-) Transcript_37013:127-2118(-)
MRAAPSPPRARASSPLRAAPSPLVPLRSVLLPLIRYLLGLLVARLAVEDILPLCDLAPNGHRRRAPHGPRARALRAVGQTVARVGLEAAARPAQRRAPAEARRPHRLLRFQRRPRRARPIGAMSRRALGRLAHGGILCEETFQRVGDDGLALVVVLILELIKLVEPARSVAEAVRAELVAAVQLEEVQAEGLLVDPRDLELVEIVRDAGLGAAVGAVDVERVPREDDPPARRADVRVAQRGVLLLGVPQHVDVGAKQVAAARVQQVLRRDLAVDRRVDALAPFEDVKLHRRLAALHGRHLQYRERLVAELLAHGVDHGVLEVDAELAQHVRLRVVLALRHDREAHHDVPRDARQQDRVVDLDGLARLGLLRVQLVRRRRLHDLALQHVHDAHLHPHLHLVLELLHGRRDLEVAEPADVHEDGPPDAAVQLLIRLPCAQPPHVRLRLDDESARLVVQAPHVVPPEDPRDVPRGLVLERALQELLAPLGVVAVAEPEVFDAVAADPLPALLVDHPALLLGQVGDAAHVRHDVAVEARRGLARRGLHADVAEERPAVALLPELERRLLHDVLEAIPSAGQEREALPRVERELPRDSARREGALPRQQRALLLANLAVVGRAHLVPELVRPDPGLRAVVGVEVLPRRQLRGGHAAAALRHGVDAGGP